VALAANRRKWITHTNPLEAILPDSRGPIVARMFRDALEELPKACERKGGPRCKGVSARVAAARRKGTSMRARHGSPIILAV
jgi:hypothetical protein